MVIIIYRRYLALHLRGNDCFYRAKTATVFFVHDDASDRRLDRFCAEKFVLRPSLRPIGLIGVFIFSVGNETHGYTDGKSRP